MAPLDFWGLVGLYSAYNLSHFSVAVYDEVGGYLAAIRDASHEIVRSDFFREAPISVSLGKRSSGLAGQHSLV